MDFKTINGLKQIAEKCKRNEYTQCIIAIKVHNDYKAVKGMFETEVIEYQGMGHPSEDIGTDVYVAQVTVFGVKFIFTNSKNVERDTIHYL